MLVRIEVADRWGHQRGRIGWWAWGSTMSDLLNAFSAAGLWLEKVLEPHLSEDAAREYPHKQEWMNKYLGILVFKLRPIPRR